MPVGCSILLWICCLLWAASPAHAQCQRQIRKYADEHQYNSGIVTNPNASIDKNITTYSTLSVLLIGSASQYMEFDERIPAGTRAYVKVSTFNGLVGVLPSFTIQAYVNSSSGRTPVAPKLENAQLLGLLNGDGSMELSFVPEQAFDGVVVTINGVGLGYSMKVYDAYIYRNTTAFIACNGVVDVLNGVSPALNIAAVGSVTSPWNAVDTDPVSAAVMKMDVNVGGSVYETVIFNTPSVAGDSVRIMLSRPNGSLLDLLVLGNFSVQPYLGSTPVGPAITSASAGLQLRLLAPGSDVNILTAAIAGSFDRVEIKLNAVAGVLLLLNVHDVTRLSPQPVVSFLLNGSPGPGPVCITQAGNIQLSVASPEACATYRWYNGATSIGTGNSIQPSVTTTGAYTFYVEAQRTGCSNTETRVPVSFTVVPKAGPPALTIQNNP